MAGLGLRNGEARAGDVNNGVADDVYPRARSDLLHMDQPGKRAEGP